MNLNISNRKGRTYLYIERKYWDKEKKQSRSVNVKTLGFLDELAKQYSDPIAHFREVARVMTTEEKANAKQTLTLDFSERLDMASQRRFNLGYAVIVQVFHQLGLDRFLNNKARHENFDYNTYSIMKLLVVSRLLSPGSKKKTFEERGRYFESFNFTLADLYRALSHFAAIGEELQRFLSEQVAATYGRDTHIVYYDVTNYYFEIDREDAFRKWGKGKEGRKNPIVQMGLAMDADGIPLHYELFPGNTLDKQTFRSVIGEVRRNYNTGRIIAVADMGIITGDNIYYLKGGDRDTRKNGYIFSFSVRGGTDDFKDYVLSEAGYMGSDGKPAETDADFKIKVRHTLRDIFVTMQGGKTVKKTVDEKQVVFWSRKYADKAKAERESIVKKAQDIVNNPRGYRKGSTYGADKYIKGLTFDKNTDEIIQGTTVLSFDTEKLKEEEKYDGYYAIVTSELDMPTQEIIDTYRGLWEIEESFRISKGTLEARPIYLSLEDHICAHMLTCFISLLILRIIQKKTDRHFPAQQIVDCLNEISCAQEDENLFLFDYRSPLSDAIGKAFDIDFTRKRLRLGEIKKLLASAKKS